MHKIRHIPVIITILLLVLAGCSAGLFAPFDNAIQNFRFSLSKQVTVTDTVFVAIDSESIRSVGVWPWPRRVHAELVDRLVEMNASNIIFDIDFSTPSNEVDDSLFEAALERAGGFVMLGGFHHTFTNTADRLDFNLPLPRFARHADPVMVNVASDNDGVIRRYPYGFEWNGNAYPSVATALTGEEARRSGSFLIDFGIDAGTIDQISLASILDGSVDPLRISDKHIVVGASALELRDTFTVPRYGIMPGAVLQILAAETLKQERALIPVGSWLEFGAAVIFALGFAILRQRYKLFVAISAALASSILVEIVGLALQLSAGIILNTTAIHTAVAGVAISGLALELGLRQFLLNKTTHERNTTKRILDRVISDNFDGVVVINEDGIILTASKHANATLGFTSENALAGNHVSAVLPMELAVEVNSALSLADSFLVAPAAREISIEGRDDEKKIIEYVVTLSRVESDADLATTIVVCLTFRDITERRTNERRLSFLADHDPLTGAFSRSKLAELIAECVLSKDGRETGITLMTLNLSRFKAVNDTLGHTYGDAILKQVVSRLRALDVECVARLGGDSFAIAITGILDGADLEEFCNDALARLTDIYLLDEHRAYIGVQLGITSTRISGYDPEILLAHSDMALSSATENPGSCFAEYTPDMDTRVLDMREMELGLRTALLQDQLFLLYQPQVCLETGRLEGAEALLRWSHPERGLISPEKFIPVAEETGLIVDITRWILKAACTQAKQWPDELRLAVNLSPLQFVFGDVVADVRSALEESGLPAARLDIEITEGIFISNHRMVTEALNALKDMGVGVALDDFGTGYSSLSYLGKLPIDKIKIDQAFVRGLPEDQESAAIISAVITLSQSLGKKVVAEGIENADQAWTLKLAGCHTGQGYHFGRPLESSALVEQYSQQQPDVSIAV